MDRHRMQPRAYALTAWIVNASTRARAVRAVLLAAIVTTIMAVLGPQAGALAATRLVVLGDSLTAGYGLAARDAFPARLEAALRARGHDVTVVDAGVSGDTSAGGKARVAWTLGAEPAPDAAIVALGANDGLRGIAPEEMRANLDAILTAFGKAGVPVLLTGMKAPRNFGAAYVRAFEAAFPALAEKHDALFYPFFLEGVALDPALNQGDGLHPNAQGVARMVDGILPLAETLIARAGDAPASEGAR